MAAQTSALIVADSAQLRDSLLILLRAIPSLKAIHQVTNGPAALAISAGLEPTLVILDYDLSWNGPSRTLGRIKAKRPQARFVALVDCEQQVQRAEAAGADVVLVKGVRAAKLLETIESLIAS